MASDMPADQPSSTSGPNSKQSAGERTAANKRNWLATGVGLATIIGTGVAVYTAVDRIPFVSPVFSLQVPPYAQNVVRNASTELALSVDNKATHEALDLKAYACSLNGAPHGVSVEAVRDKNCDFTIKNVAISERVARWPITVDFNMTIIDQAKTKNSASATIYFHDIEQPVIEQESVRWVDGKLTISFNIIKNREDAAEVISCEWRPTELFVDPIVPGQSGQSCSANFKRRAATRSMPPISVVVTFKSSEGLPFDARSDEFIISIPPEPVRMAGQAVPGEHALAAPPLLPTTLAKPVPLAPSPGSSSLGGLNSPTATGTNAAALLASLDGYRDTERYDRLAAGLQGLARDARLTPNEGLDLLGPLTGNLRLGALSSLILPRLSTPIASDQAASLIQGFSSPGRADLLHGLAGCFTQPIDKAVLLIDIFGADLQWVEPALNSTGPCKIAQSGPK